MADPLNPNHPSRIAEAQRTAQGQQNRMMRPPALSGLSRPDGAMGQLTNQNMPSTGYLMNAGNIYGRHDGDQNFADSPVGSGAMGVGGSHALTGGGSAGALASQQAGQQRGQGLMGSMPKLAAMQPFDKNSKPNTGGMFAQLDNQVNRMASNERSTGHAAAGGDPMAAALTSKPAGIAATGGAGMAQSFKHVQDPGVPFKPPPMAALGARPQVAPVATRNGQIDPRFVGNKQQVQRAQGAVNGANVARNGLAGPPANMGGPAQPNIMAQALNAGPIQPSLGNPHMASYEAGMAIANQIGNREGSGSPNHRAALAEAQHHLPLAIHFDEMNARRQHDQALLGIESKKLALEEKQSTTRGEFTKSETDLNKTRVADFNRKANEDPGEAALKSQRTAGTISQPDYDIGMADLGRRKQYGAFKATAPLTGATIGQVPNSLASAGARSELPELGKVLNGEDTDPADVYAAMTKRGINPSSPQGDLIRRSLQQEMGNDRFASAAVGGMQPHTPVTNVLRSLALAFSRPEARLSKDWLHAGLPKMAPTGPPPTVAKVQVPTPAPVTDPRKGRSIMWPVDL